MSIRHQSEFPRFLLFVLALSGILRSEAARAERPEGAVTFEATIRPILKAQCFECHGENEKPKGKLDLRLRHLMVTGGESGAAIVPGQPSESLLFQRIRDGEMPKGKKKLSGRELSLIERWIADGAKTARTEPAQPPAAMITEEERAFWAFQPIQNPAAPQVPPEIRVRNVIDSFIWLGLSRSGLSFSREADRSTLIRRAYFDLIGLPPSPAEVESFVADSSPDAYEKLIDRLLAAPQYGERWGRHWLDVAGYAESDGATDSDTPRRFAWKYRDYVIRSFNADKPFDQFIQEQLAGDEMVKPPYADLDEASRERLIATGFLRMAPDGTETDDQKLSRNQTIAETIKIVSSSLLGLTVGCAQCHDHRYDPIPQIDYYRFRAIFDPVFDVHRWRRPSQRLISLATPQDRKKAEEIEARARVMDDEVSHRQKIAFEKVFERELAKVPEAEREAVRVARNTAREKRNVDQVALLKRYPSADVYRQLDIYDPPAYQQIQAERAKVAEFRATKPPEDYIAAATEFLEPTQAALGVAQLPDSRLFYRGDPDQPKQSINPGELTVLAAARSSPDIAVRDSSLSTTGRRLAYARMLTDGTHPHVARVLVNRVWMHHLGRGIVATPGDFGVLGERPTHPELLDWLAADFMSNGWRLKRLHKLIMTSATYRQGTQRSSIQETVDPENRLLARANIRRLEAEVIRDSILSVSGKLNPAPFGPSIPVGEDQEGQIIVGRQKRNVNNEAIGVESPGSEEFRRSIYIEVRRRQPLALLETFDLPTMLPNCDMRRASTVPTQSLLFMNNAFVTSQSEFLAQRLLQECPIDPAARMRQAWMLLYGRAPTAADLSTAQRFLAEQEEYFQTQQMSKPPQAAQLPSTQRDPRLAALATLCQAMLSSNRFLYVE